MIFLSSITMSLFAILPKLEVSQTNSHYFETSNGEPFFINADTAWGLGREISKYYLDQRKKQKFNAIAMVAATPTRSSFYGDHPFKMVNGKWDPTQPIIKPGSELKGKKDESISFAQQICHLRKLFTDYPWYALVLSQDNSFLAHESWEGNFRIQGALSKDGKYAVVYIPDDMQVWIDLNRLKGEIG